ncbi:MAG: phage tail protein [Cellvibrionaceae bacterium]
MKALHAAILQTGLLAAEQLDSFMESAPMIPQGSKIGEGIELFSCTYRAVYEIERLEGDNAPLLLAAVCAWLLDNDSDREDDELDWPEIDIDTNDTTTADIELSLLFKESLFLVPDANGAIHYGGETWRIDQPVIDVADHTNVAHDGQPPGLTHNYDD